MRVQLTFTNERQRQMCQWRQVAADTEDVYASVAAAQLRPSTGVIR